MSEDIYAAPDLSKKVRFQTEEKADANADVTDNVNIYDNYMPQGSMPLELQDSSTEDLQKAISVNVPSGGRNLLRPAAMFLVLLWLLFLTGVVVLGVLLSQVKEHNADLTRARDELQTRYGEMKSLNANLTQKTNQLDKEIYHLKVIESNLTTENNQLKQRQESSCCPDYWTRFGNRCYLISSSKKNWTESKSSCEKQHAELVIISSEQEQNFISSLHDTVWIGLSYDLEERVWKWVNGSVAMQMYWGDNQPDKWNNIEDCVESSEKWNDLRCDSLRDFVCEKIWYNPG